MNIKKIAGYSIFALLIFLVAFLPPILQLGWLGIAVGFLTLAISGLLIGLVLLACKWTMD